MKKSLFLFLTLILLTPSLVFSSIVTFKVGFFIPQAKSDLWEDEFYNMNWNKINFQNTNFGFSYEYILTREISITLGLDSYTKTKAGNYEGYVGYEDLFYDPALQEWLDFAFPDDYEGDYIPTHTFSVSITPIQLSLKLTPLGRRGKFIPYIGGGVGLYLWTVRLYGGGLAYYGDFIDFADEWYYNESTGEIHYDNPDFDVDIRIYPIRPVDAWERNRFTIGYHAFGGVMIPVARRFTLEVELKYNYAHGELKKGFEGFEPFDLSGYQVSLGLNYWF